MKNSFFRQTVFCISTVLLCISMNSLPVYADVSFVGPVNLTDDEKQWINDTYQKHEAVKTKDAQFQYKIERDPHLCAVITDYTGNESDIVFRDYADYVRVTESCVDFSERDDITSVTYNGLYHFGEYSDNFQNCKNLAALTVNAEPTGELRALYDLDEEYLNDPFGRCLLHGSFAGCTALKTITLPHSSSERIECYINEGVFEGCTALQELDASGCWNIRDDAFINCTALEKVIFDENIKEIRAHAFGYTKNEDGTYQRYDGLTIYGAAGTAAETYALENDIPFVNLGRTGDIDESGEVDVSDAVLLARFFAEDDEAVIGSAGMQHLDVNKDGAKNQDDVVQILRMIAQII